MEEDGSGGGDLVRRPSGSASPSQPREGAFRPFKGFRSSGESSLKSRSLRVVVGMPVCFYLLFFLCAFLVNISCSVEVR